MLPTAFRAPLTPRLRQQYSGLGFGTTVTSFIFIGLITLTVIYMTITHRGEEVAPAERSANEMNPAYGEDVEG